MRVLGVGIATLDIINRVARYPSEDEEVRATAQRRVRGGNVTNSLIVLAQLGHQAQWAGTLGAVSDSQIIEQDLRHYAVGMDYCRRYPEAAAPTSYVTLSEASGSRTIVHYRDLPEYDLASFQTIPLESFDWLHFEGRHVPALGGMLRLAVESGMRCSLEVEKPREGIEALFDLPDMLLFSRHYAQWRGYDSAAGFLRQAAPAGKECYCAWGDEGAWVLEPDGQVSHSPAFVPDCVVDTLGAGDVFNAAVIHGRAAGLRPPQALEAACRTAGDKCGIEGFEGLGQRLAGCFSGDSGDG